MDDENKSTADGEYHFAEIGDVTPKSNVYSGGSSPKKMGRNIVRRNVLVGVGVLLVVVFAYKLYGVLFDGKPTAEEPQQKVVEPKQMVAKPVVQASNTPVGMSEAQKQNAEKMRGEMLNLQQEVDQVENKMGDVNRVLQQMLQQLQSQQKLLLALQKAQTKKTVKKTAAKPRKKYFVKALVPGRAWLFNGKGDFLTVIRGTSVPRYGRVRSINVERGLVTTTTGDKIGFAASDL